MKANIRTDGKHIGRFLPAEDWHTWTWPELQHEWKHYDYVRARRGIMHYHESKYYSKPPIRPLYSPQ